MVRGHWFWNTKMLPEGKGWEVIFSKVSSLYTIQSQSITVVLELSGFVSSLLVTTTQSPSQYSNNYQPMKVAIVTTRSKQLPLSTGSLPENNWWSQINAFLKTHVASVWNLLRNAICYFEVSLKNTPTSFYFFLSASSNLLQNKSKALFCSIFYQKDISLAICILSFNQNTFYTVLKIWQHT